MELNTHAIDRSTIRHTIASANDDGGMSDTSVLLSVDMGMLLSLPYIALSWLSTCLILRSTRRPLSNTL